MLSTTIVVAVWRWSAVSDISSYALQMYVRWACEAVSSSDASNEVVSSLPLSTVDVVVARSLVLSWQRLSVLRFEPIGCIR